MTDGSITFNLPYINQWRAKPNLEDKLGKPIFLIFSLNI